MGIFSFLSRPANDDYDLSKRIDDFSEKINLHKKELNQEFLEITIETAIEIILETGNASTSMLQRQMNLKYSEAARLIDVIEEIGIIGPFNGSKPREILVEKEHWHRALADLRKSKTTLPVQRKKAGLLKRINWKAVLVFFGVFLVYNLIGSNFFPKDENNVLQVPGWYPILGIAISGFAAYKVAKGKGQGNGRWLVKTLLTAFLVWLGLTIVFLVLESAFNIGDKASWFSVVAVLFPIFCAIAYIVVALKKGPFPTGKVIYAPKTTPVYERPATNPPQAQGPVNVPTQKKNIMDIIDQMEGHEFERFCAELLKDYGYQDVHVTRESGDQGVDIVAVKHGMRYAFQCKRYSSKLSNAAIQQVNAGKMIYSCMKAVVITNNYFTSGAKQAAKATGVELWGRDVLIDKIARLQKKEGPRYQS